MTAPTDELVRRLAADVPSYERASAAYLGGSRAFGLDNALSDVDLTVVFPDDHPLPDPPVVVRLLGDVHGHAELVHERDVLRRCATFDVEHLRSAAALPGAEAVRRDLRPVLEAVAGEAVVDGPFLAGLRRRVTVERLAALSAETHAVFLAAFLRDADGALRSGHLFVAYGAATQVLEQGVEAALAATGELYPSRKFLVERLRRSPAVGVWFDDVWRLTTSAPPADDEDALRAHVGDLLAAGAWLAGAALLDAVEVADEPPWRRAGGAAGAFAVPPTTALLRGDEGLRLAVDDVEHRVGPQAALLWLWAHGRTVDDLAALLVRRYPHIAIADAERFCRVNAAGLVGIGALRTT